MRTTIIASAWVLAFTTSEMADAASDYVYTCKSLLDEGGVTWQASKSFVIGWLEGYFVDDLLASKLTDEDITKIGAQVYYMCKTNTELQLVDVLTKVAFTLRRRK